MDVYPLLHYEFLMEEKPTKSEKAEKPNPPAKEPLLSEQLSIVESTPKGKGYGSFSLSTASTEEGDSTDDDSDMSVMSFAWCFNVFSEDALNNFRKVGKRHAHERRDVLLCWKLCELIDLDEVASEALIVTVFRNIRLLHLCKYDFMDIMLTMAHCAFYISEAIAMDGLDDYLRADCAAINISVFFFLATAHLLDHCAPLKCWTKHVFVDRVSIDCFSRRVMKLFRNRGFKLQVDFDESVAKIYEELTMAVDAYAQQPELTELQELALPRVSLSPMGPGGLHFPT